MTKTSIRLKFIASADPAKEGLLVFQLTCNRVTRRVASGYKILNEEWDKASGQIVLPPMGDARRDSLLSIRLNLEWRLQTYTRIFEELDAPASVACADDLARRLASSVDVDRSVFNFMHTQAVRKMRLGKVRSNETYRSALNSFARFRKGVDLTFDKIDSEMMELYEAELRGRGLSRNTTSFYMRILRTNYRLAVAHGLTHDCRPFSHVYCGMDKTVKRCISFAEIKKIKDLDLSRRPRLDFARDMFLFSFCTRGMSFIDMAYLKKDDLRNGYLTYRRKKTGQLLVIEWTEQMQGILDKCQPNDTRYLLPIVTREDGSERRQYQNWIMKINRRLKTIAVLAGVPVPLSLYWSRHSWATIARSKEVPLSVISKGLGHDSELTTQIYLDSIKSAEVDKANRRILNDL